MGNDAVTRAELLARGLTGSGIARAVHRGELIRVRRGHYASPEDSDDMIRAVRVGGRLDCVSELRARGVWVVDDPTLHVRLPPGASRLRDADDRKVRMTAPDIATAPLRLHWRELRAPSQATASHVGLIDALVSAAGCLPSGELIAALDSACHQRVIGPQELREALALIAARRRPTSERLDAGAESGLETMIRDLCAQLGLRVRIQVEFDGVGRVDMFVEDWVVVELDGRAHHSGEVATRDRRRDAVHMAQGRLPLRFVFAQVVFDRRSVALAIIGAVRTHRRIADRAYLADRALRRLAYLELDRA
ncbi:type IV toxin-antitoxin system AbiEi family antitoxin domain-containing protein [Schumannella sp. 10F1B-5-1]|uniref:type IV toxin-antitoxin system AbiEi family antitoxin domain-containing protein n=1 Tax=Schumannella sp. 10F1B-5-1 TaxID=2590780 RepID=UPI0015E85C86|nr:type IV toxin-antitoxin system AbiEi family antitoxin domain-containing protein [Schumannella sp. 10F1B-5-1]